MSAVTRDALWQRLVEAGLAAGGQPEPDPQGGPWYVRAMLGVAGWIGALFLLSFVGAAMAFVFKDETAAVAVGLICCAAAFGIFRAAARNDFLAQFGLALSLAGQVLFIFGMYKSFRSDPVGYALMIALFQAVLALLLANPVNRVWSTWMAMLALAYGLSKLGYAGLTPVMAVLALAVIWLREPLWALRGGFWRPIGYGLALSLVNIEVMLGLGQSFDLWPRRVSPAWPLWLSPALAGALWTGVVFLLLLRHHVPATGRAGAAALIAAAAVAIVARDVPGLAAALLLMTLGYASGAKVLLGLGVLALLTCLSHYYYALQITLLAKSGVLAATGAVLIGLWLGMRLLLPYDGHREHGDA